jgi:hypothetical protein
MRNWALVGGLFLASWLVGACTDSTHQPASSPRPPTLATKPSAMAPSASVPPSITPTSLGATDPVNPPALVGRALATPDAGSGWIEITIAEQETTCEKRMTFPADCVPASRIRISLPPELQTPGTHRFGASPGVFGYRDAQGPTPGAWEKGARCSNLGTPIDNGSLTIESINASEIAIRLEGTRVGDGRFTALRCSSCKGTGMRCSSDRECCASNCGGGTCHP